MKNLETIDSKLKMNIQLLASEGENNSQASEGGEDNQSSQNNEQLSNNEKTFTQADIDKIIGKQFAKWQSKMEAEKEKAKEEALKAKELEQMSAEDRAKKKMEELQNEVEKMKSERAREALTSSTLKEMSVRGIDADFLDFVIGKDVETTKERLDIFEAKFNSMVDAKVEAIIAERMKGITPITSTKTSVLSEFTAEDVKKMSVDEINRNWDKIKHIKLG